MRLWTNSGDWKASKALCRLITRRHGIPASQSYALQRVQLQVAIAEPVLRVLFAANRHVEDLTVTEASLEQAFLHLTGEISEDEPEPAPFPATAAKGSLT